MRTKVSLKAIALSAILLFSGMAASAANKSNLIFNSEERDGMMIGQTVYKMEGSTLVNYMKHNYKYDNDKRMIESETLKWNSSESNWQNDICTRYAYKGKSVTTTYYKWNSKKQQYILAPELTVTMDNVNL